MNEIIITKDGSHSIQSEKFGVTYHSIHGAIQETQHVFIEAGLYHKQQYQSNPISILEIGWGTGLNSYMTLLEAERQSLPIHFVTTEAYPIALEQAKALNYHEQLQQKSNETLLLLHQATWGEAHTITPHFTFTKHQMLFEDIDFKNEFDLIYFDAFAPTAQAEFWEEDFLSKMYKALRPQGVLVTYCAKGSFKRALKTVGFTIESIPGPPGKREMTRGTVPSSK